MIRVGNKPVNESEDNDVYVDLSRAKVLPKTIHGAYPQIAIPLRVNGRDNFDDISISLWGGSVFSYSVHYNHSAHGGMLKHEFKGHSSLLNEDKIKKDDFIKFYKGKAPNMREISNFLETAVSKVWRTEVSVVGKLDQRLFDDLVDKMVRYFGLK